MVKGAGSLFLPLASAAAGVMLPPMVGKRDQRGTGRCGFVVGENRGQQQKSLTGDKTSPCSLLSSSAATGYLATPSCCLQVAPS